MTGANAICISSMALLLAGCSTPSGALRVVTQAVDVPVAVSCVPAGFPAPIDAPTAEALRALPDAAARYQALAAFYLEASPRLALDERTIADCRAAAASK